MRAAVIGLGSMGKRRIRLIHQYDPGLELVGIDMDRKRTYIGEELGIRTYLSIDEAYACTKFACAFVCTSPLTHASIIRWLAAHKVHVFTELNLVSDGYDEIMKYDAVKVFLSSTFLYRKDLQQMAKRVNGQRVNYMYHTGQYLPDWHPWEDYSSFFAADKRTSGCREILAVELPWILECFGKIKNISVLKDKMSGLRIDYPDNYLLQVEHENGNKGQIAVDVIARKAVRRIEVFNEKLQLYWSGTPDSLQEWDYEKKSMRDIPSYDDVVTDKNYCENIIENAYMDEIAAFFAWLSGDSSKVLYSFEKDREVLKIIDFIEGL